MNLKNSEEIAKPYESEYNVALHISSAEGRQIISLYDNV
jgi:hypothetical protein